MTHRDDIMKRLVLIVLLITCVVGLLACEKKVSTEKDNVPIKKIVFSDEEKQWLKRNQKRVFMMGLDPYAGMEFFVDQGKPMGYASDLAAVMHRDLGINVKLVTDETWNTVFEGLKQKKVDILLGANETPDRKLFMAFTKPVYSYPYALLTSDKSSVHIIGDVDGKKVGFLKGDVVTGTFSSYYRNVHLEKVFFDSQEEGIQALQKGTIDGFITAGGETAYDYMNKYPGIRMATDIETISSDMTLSTRYEDRMLVQILNKEIDYLSGHELDKMIGNARIHYIRKILHLTEAERKWLETDGHLTVGVTKNYLPFEYMKDGQYMGISGAVLKDMSARIGLKLSYKYDDFDVLYNDLVAGRIQVMNIAKTDARTKLFLYPKPYMLERDLIYGIQGSRDVVDIYGLEGKRVAVVKGYYQSEMLQKNLMNPIIIETEDIQASMKMVTQGKADYFIENPSVVRYYMEELDLYNLVQKGTTSSDTYLYYGIAHNRPEVASIMNKLIPLMDMEDLARIGYEEVPRKTGAQRYVVFITIIVGLTGVIILIGFALNRKISELISVRTDRELLRQREQFLYRDILTGLYNRNYFNDKILDQLDTAPFPQTLIVGDLNNLKDVNDLHGHHTGDLLLSTYAEVLKTEAEGADIIRMGGDEFFIISKNADVLGSGGLLERLKASNHQRKIKTPDGGEISLWAAYGHAQRFNLQTPFDEVIKLADQSMYSEKALQKKRLELKKPL